MRDGGQERRITFVFASKDSYETQVAHSLADYARLYNLRWNWTTERADQNLRAVVRTWRPHAIVLRHDDPRFEAYLRRQNIPAVSIGLPATSRRRLIPTVVPDGEAVGRMAAEHLIPRGLRRFGFVGPGRSYLKPRQRGFESVLKAAGLPCDMARIEQVTWRSWSLERRVREMMNWLARLRPPVGIFAAEDLWAVRIMLACDRMGLRVPEDVAIIGAGNDEIYCEVARRPISSVAMDVQRIGHKIGGLLECMLRGEPTPSDPVFVPPLGVVTRSSTDTIAVEDAKIAAAMRFIRDHCRQSITVNDVAEHVSLPRRSLEARFKQCLNRMPGQQIRLARIEQVKMLLADTDLRIHRIAELCGFTRAESLSVTFRRVTGLTPRQYRERVGKTDAM